MATFTAASPATVAVDMGFLFRWISSGVGGFTIGSIVITDLPDDEAEVTDASDSDIVVTYFGVGTLALLGTDLQSGIYDEMTLTLSGVTVGTISGFSAANFDDIDTPQAMRVLDGDDTINGSVLADLLFAGHSGNDTFNGNGGGDSFVVPAAFGAPTHVINGASGSHDKIVVSRNEFSGATTLNLRSATLSSINEIVINNDGFAVQLNSSQIGPTAGLSTSATITGPSAGGLLFIGMNTAALNLAGFTVTGGVEVAVLGTNAGETITGTNGKDTVTPGNGADTVNGLGGNDTFNVIATDSQFDAFNGGSGSDKIKIFGTTALTLNGFNAASQAIEVWEGNGQGLAGNGNANVFNLTGLTTKTGLTSISGLAGNDTITGSKFADTIAASGTDAQFDTTNGGLGTDTFRADGSGPLTLNGFNAATQSIEVWSGNGQTLFGNGNANFINLAGLTSMVGLPFVEGLAGNDTLTGSKFADRLLGGDGNDTMSAGAGDDELEGGFGVDTMTGGLGGDRFDFDAVVEIGKKKGLLDLIIDWGDGDTIDLSSIDANGSKKGDKAFKFLKKEGADFTKVGQVGFDQKKGNTFVQGDTNGDGKADFKLQVAGKIDFEKADFVL